MHDSSTLQQHLSDEAVKNIMNWLEQPKYLQYKSELSSMIEQQQWKEQQFQQGEERERQQREPQKREQREQQEQ